MGKVCIIGAGLAGLSAGIYLRQAGVDTEIFELAPWAGGMCTAWVREGYRFDGCIHWMVGTKPGDEYYKLYREVDALLDDTPVYNPAEILVECGGVSYEIPMECARFRAFLHALSAQDHARIDRFCDDVDIMAREPMPIQTPESLADGAKMLRDSGGVLRLFGKYTGKTVSSVVSGFRSPAVRALLLSLMPAEFSAVALILMLGTRMGGNAGYPMGGALGVVQRMEDKYRALGGALRLNARVDAIEITDGSARGVRSGGVFYPADGVIAACDAFDTLRVMLAGKYPHPALDRMLDKAPLFDPLAVVSFGLDQRLGIPHSAQVEHPEGIEVAPGVLARGFSLRSFDFDESAAPEHGSSVMVMLEAPLPYWQDLRAADREKYRLRKQRLADAVADAIERRFPGFRRAVRVTDVATPATYLRLTNAYRASYEGFAPTPAALRTRIPRTLPRLNRLCLCGQWVVVGGGICSAILDGKQAAAFMQKALRG